MAVSLSISSQIMNIKRVCELYMVYVASITFCAFLVHNALCSGQNNYVILRRPHRDNVAMQAHCMHASHMRVCVLGKMVRRVRDSARWTEREFSTAVCQRQDQTSRVDRRTTANISDSGPDERSEVKNNLRLGSFRVGERAEQRKEAVSRRQGQMSSTDKRARPSVSATYAW